MIPGRLFINLVYRISTLSTRVEWARSSAWPRAPVLYDHQAPAVPPLSGGRAGKIVAWCFLGKREVVGSKPAFSYPEGHKRKSWSKKKVARVSEATFCGNPSGPIVPLKSI